MHWLDIVVTGQESPSLFFSMIVRKTLNQRVFEFFRLSNLCAQGRHDFKEVKEKSYFDQLKVSAELQKQLF